MRIFFPGLSARSRSATRRPRRPASMAHIRPAAPAPRTTTSNDRTSEEDGLPAFMCAAGSEIFPAFLDFRVFHIMRPESYGFWLRCDLSRCSRRTPCLFFDSRAILLQQDDRKERIPMFCYQCEQTSKGEGCQTLGVCGKDETTAILQDL